MVKRGNDSREKQVPLSRRGEMKLTTRGKDKAPVKVKKKIEGHFLW